MCPMRYAGQHIRPAVSVEMPLQCEFMAADKVPAVAFALNKQARQCLLFHAESGCPLIVFKDFLKVRRTIAPSFIDAVEALGVAAGPVINLPLVIAAHLQLVRGTADRPAVLDGLVGLQMLMRQFEAVVPKRVLAGA